MTKTSSSTLDRQGPEASSDASGPRPPAGGSDGTRVAVFGGGLVLAGLGAAAVGSVAGELTASATTTAVRLVLLVGGAVVAGLGLLRPFTGVPGKAHRRTVWAAGLLAAAAALAGYLSGDVGRTGTLVWVLAAVAVPVLLGTRRSWLSPVAALPAAGLVAMTLGSGHTGAAFAADVTYALAATVLVGALVAGLLRSVDGATGETAADVLIAGPGSDPAAAPGRPDLLVVVGLVGGSIAVLAGLVRISTEGPFSWTDLVGTAYGRAVLAALLLPALVVAALVAELRARRRRVAHVAYGAARRNGVRQMPYRHADAARSARWAGAAAAVVGVAAASVAGLLPAPAPATVTGQPLLRTVALDGENVPVLIAPMRPGPNLVQLGGSGYTPTGDRPAPTADGAAGATGTTGPAGAAMAGHDGSGQGASGHDMVDHGGRATVEAGGDPVPFVSRVGARGGWAVVDIPAGTGSVTVTMGGDSATVPVSVDGTGPTSGSGSVSSALVGRDGPECASAIVGAALAGGPGTGVLESCPAQSLDPEQASALRATVAHMAAQGARTARLVSDPSPRSVAAARLVREEAARVGLAFGPDAVNDPNSALIVVSGWEQAVATLGEAGLRAQSTPTHLGGTFLAPWLLTGDVLRQAASSFLPLPFAPNEPEAQRYAIALGATYPDTAPSASGYLAWARAAGVATDDRPSLFGAAAVSVPMSIEPQGSTGHHGGPNPAAWFPGGTVVPVTGPLQGSP